MRENVLATVSMVLLLILLLDVFTENVFSTIVAEILAKISYPLYISREYLESFFEKRPTTINVTLFGKREDVLVILSEDTNGFYVKDLETRGLVIEPRSRQLIGFVERTGKIGYVRKWWESEFPVTVESSETRVVGFYRKLRIEIPDPQLEVAGKVYLADSEEYGRLLRAHDISIGTFNDGYFQPKIPRIPKYVIVLPSYEEYDEGARK
ncbi:hypothetical protein [Fervidobacterium thailandense]|uniref:Uncharacterized protein n=1 Tax=Fervidobacterium thailandense TaxID=1008305 RepID=A0A1E3G6N8_9BACT|nr:hypothetical protein [Fervidobacterium thailandense]ODN31278.1 hypothetical protein A4H02_00410 [Fervidobacterium thailandense]